MLNRKELADLLKVNERTIDKWVKNGMPCIKLERFIRFDYEKVLKWLEVGAK